MNLKTLWMRVGDSIGRTLLHPQYAAKRGEYFAVDYLSRHARGVLLDIGCGRQPHRKTLAPRVDRYIGLDLPKNLSYYRSPYPVELQADARHIPLPNASIDTAMMLWVVEHLEDPDAVFSEIRRVLRPRGLFVVYFVENYPAHGYPPNFRRYTPAGMRRLLSRHGLETTRLESFGTTFETMVTYANVGVIEWVKYSMFEKHLVLIGLIVLCFASPLLVAGNCIAYVLGRIGFLQRHAIGHVAIARRKRAR